MNNDRPLAGCTVGISISESDEMVRLGFDRSEMNRCVVRLSEALLSTGARLAFGHDWRPGGVMEAVAALAVRYFNVRRDEAGRPLEGKAPILNFVAPPDIPFLTEQRELSGRPEAPGAALPVNPMVRLLEGIVDARQINAPAHANRSDALSIMRRELAKLCNLRVCLGGKLTGFAGRMPGVIEEALGTLREGRPVFASGIFGGASRMIARSLGAGTIEFENTPSAMDFETELAEIRSRAVGAPRGLDEAEDLRLWQSTSIEECIELILRGAVKSWAARRQR